MNHTVIGRYNEALTAAQLGSHYLDQFQIHEIVTRVTGCDWTQYRGS
jgi:hypothetical protein